MNGLQIRDLTFTLMRIRLNLYFFASKRKTKKVPRLKVNYKNIQIKQHLKVTHLGCILNKTMSVEAMPQKVINKIN